MKLTVIVPARDAQETITQCLAALRAELVEGDELIVVDDGSLDATGRLAEHEGARLVRRLKSRGPAVARNEGARLARGDVLLFVDADVVVPVGMRRRLAVHLAGRKCAAAVAILAPRTPVRDLASRYENHYMYWAYRRGPDRLAVLYSSAAAVRRDLFATLGGFDEGYRSPSVEDMDLGVRLALAGHSPRVLKEIEVVHLKRFGLAGLLRINARKACATLRLRWRNRGRFAPRSVAAPSWFVAGIPLTVLGVLLVGAALLRPGLAPVAGIFLLAAVGLRWPFLASLVRHEGVGLGAVAPLLVLANDVAYAVGIVLGALGWAAGRRY